MKPVVLVILDGFGVAPSGPGNAITSARTPNLTAWKKQYPYTTLRASGLDVGLPQGNQGTSEAGHITIGAGRIVYQPSVAIDRGIRDGSFFANPALMDVMRDVKAKGSTLHVMGLLSDAGVHAHIAHLFAVLRMAKEQGVAAVAVHLFLDGRDVPEKSAGIYIDLLEAEMKKLRVGFIASLIGRYYAMDRDDNWGRTEKAYNLLVGGKGTEVPSARDGITQAYATDVRSDYYIEPMVIGARGESTRMRDGDGVIFTNFRSDRARQLTYAFTEEHFEEFTRVVHLKVHFVGMSTYDKNISMPAAYPQEVVQHNLAQTLAAHGLKQFRTAETEKYAHVTFFFNSQMEEPVAGETRALVHSRKVTSFDQAPEMSAREITQAAVDAVHAHTYDFLAMNLANPDLVGHSAHLQATIKAVEVVDECLGILSKEVDVVGGVLLVTGDHGNAESMIDREGRPNPSHTMNPVPFMVIGSETKKRKLRDGGGLRDIAPTILDLLSIECPSDMTGTNLFT